MNDEFPRRQADDDPDRRPDFGFGGAPLFRDEVPRPDNPASTGFHDVSMFRDPAPAYGEGTDPLGDSGGGYRSGDYGTGIGSGTGTMPVPGLDYGAGGDYGTGIMSGFGGGGETLSSSGGFPAGVDPLGTSGRHATMAGDSGVPSQRFGGPGDAAEAGAGAGAGAGADGGGADPRWAPNDGPLRVVPADQASALLRIKLPDAPPVPSTTLRGDQAIETVVEASQMLHRASPVKPNALPGDVLALTTATMVVPMPGAAFGGVRTLQRSARLTASVPPDLASRAEADLLSDTVEQFLGDFDAIGRELEAQRASGAAAGAGSVTSTVPAQGGAVTGNEASQPAAVPGQYPPAPAAPVTPPPAGRYGVPTQVPGYETAHRSPMGMRYLGGIFHDSSGESSFYDPSTESLVPMGAAAFTAADFRRTAPAITRPVPPPRTGPGAGTPPREAAASARTAKTAAAPPSARTGAGSAGSVGTAGSGASAGSRGGGEKIHFFIDGTDETKVLPAGHWSDHHPDHHRSRRRRRRGRLAVISGVSVALAFGTLYGAALAFEGQVPNGTVVDGVAIGGMSRTAAEAKLSSALAPTLNAPMRLTADGTSFQLVPDQSGLHVDYDATVAAAASRRTDPTVAIPALAGTGREVPLRVSVDRNVLKAALTNLTAGFDKPMIDGSVIFPGGVPTPIAPRPGREVDVDAAVAAVVSAFDSGVSSAHPAAMGPAGPGEVLPTAPVAYAIAPAKTAGSPSYRYAGSHGKQPSATPSSASSGSRPTDSPSTDSPSSDSTSPSSPSSLSSSSASPSPTPTVGSSPVPFPSAPVQAPAAGSAAPGFPAAPVALTVRNVQPTVTPGAVAQAMQEFARPAMSGSVTLITGSVHTVLKPAILGRHLAIEPDGHGGLAPKLDGAGIRSELDHEALARLEQPPTDAAFTVAGGKPVLVPGKNGVGYAPEAIQNAVLPVLTKTSSAQRIATVPIGPLPPTLTTEAAQALGIRDVMGTYTAPYTASSQRTANVKNAASLVRGQIVQPGQVFSLNQVLGARSTANGFVPASGETSASAPAQDAGSGASLVATALFNAEYLAGLHDVEHHPHATVTDHFPPGMEAAVSYPDADLRFQNDSGAPVYLWTSATDNAVTVAVLGQKAYDSVQTETSPHYAVIQPKTTYSQSGSCTATDGVPGFQVDVTRILTKAGQDPIRQVFHSSYAAQDKVVCGSAGSSGTGSTTGGSATGSTSATPTGGATSASHSPAAAGGGTSSSPGGPGGTPAGGATSAGTPTGTTPEDGSDGSLLGGLLGAPSSRH